jgi:hypothetical protein
MRIVGAFLLLPVFMMFMGYFLWRLEGKKEEHYIGSLILSGFIGIAIIGFCLLMRWL